MSYFEFETEEEQDIWQQELLGQLSDGQYECSNVNWEWWHSLPTEVGDETVVHSDEDIIMNTEIDFTEIDWLFTKEHASNKKDIRSRFSTLDKDLLHTYLKRISYAMNNFATIDEDYDPYKECN